MAVQGQNYIGHNYIGHNCAGHNYAGHSYAGLTYVGEAPFRRWQLGEFSLAVNFSIPTRHEPQTHQGQTHEVLNAAKSHLREHGMEDGAEISEAHSDICQMRVAAKNDEISRLKALLEDTQRLNQAQASEIESLRAVLANESQHIREGQCSVATPWYVGMQH